MKRTAGSPVFSILLLLLAAGTLFGQSPEEADGYLRQGSDLYYRGKYADALYYFELAKNIDEQLGAGREMNLGFDYGWIGECHKMLGRFDKAEKNYRTARDLLQKAGQELYASLYTGNIGWLYKENGDLDTAFTLISEAYETGERFGAPYYISIWASHLAEIYEAWDDLEKGFELNRRAYEVAAEAEMDTQRNIVANNLTNQLFTLINTAKERRDFPAALGYAREGLDFAAEEEDRELREKYLNELGDIYLLTEDYPDAEKAYTEALSLARNLGDKSVIAVRLNNLGKTYSDWGKPERALEYFEEALELSRDSGNADEMATHLNNIGSVYHHIGDYRQAVPYYEEALRIDTERGNMQDVAVGYNNISSVYDAWGRYDDAVEYLEKALAIAKEHDFPEDEATYYNNLGLIYLAWGDYQNALDFIRKGLDIAEDLRLIGPIGRYHNNIGLIFMQMEEYSKALEHFLISKDSSEQLESEWSLAIDYNNIGTVYASLGDPDAAVRYYRQALEISKRLNQKDRQAAYLNNIGKVLIEEGDIKGAVAYYKDALALAEEMGRKNDVSVYLSNLGAAYFDLGNYREAEGYFQRTVDILEELRLTAPGKVRREYLSSQIHNYRWLVMTFMKQGKPARAFDTAELASAKYLAEQIGETLSEEDLRFSGTEAYCSGLYRDEAVVKIVQLEEERYLVLVGTNTGIHGTEVLLSGFIEETEADYGRDITRRLRQIETRGLQVSEASEEVEEGLTFDGVVRFYRYLLSKPFLRRSEAEAFSRISRRLYDVIFSPFSDYLGETTRLVILPEGPLALLPFESFQDEDGAYLVESYNISYAQSLTVLEMIGKRTYPAGRKPLLAFGGAVYNAVDYDADMVQSEEHLRELREEAIRLVSRGGSTRETYSAMGITAWSNLPGSLAEVRGIEEIVPGSRVYVGEDVEEGFIKKLSESGELSDYRRLHFATHGIVMPELPELSAVVLSQKEEPKTGGVLKEDGYLTMREIAGLKLKSDFVNLSACETGLGKLYSGEGVVGLTQAFLVAGTKGISVSLWQVADESTMRFMTGFYTLIEEKGMSYSEALTEMKRRFIRDSRLSAPFFWAAFVYYGE